MIDAATRSKYQVTIGIECHVQLKTKTKLFSGVDNDAREAPPNTLVSHICFGLPGALPVLNEAAVALASRAAFALKSTPQLFSKFDRKHYFYPDLPMGYQITQYDEPIIIGGSVDIILDGATKTIGITRAHLEADAGKTTHPAGANYSLVDLNRAGTPLLEIVSEPDMHSSQEAKAYAQELYLLMKYAGVSDANLYYGNMRFDVNVSVSQDSSLGVRSETKNLNSFRSVERAVEYEVERQIELLERGMKVVQETRGWDESKQKTTLQRTKENADDYRYMPDPDLPPIELSDVYIKKIKDSMPVLPQEWRKRLSSLGLKRAQAETLLDNPEVLHILHDLIEEDTEQKHLKNIANWLTTHLMKHIANGYDLGSEYKMDADEWRIISEMVESGDLSSSRAKDLIDSILFDGDWQNSGKSLEHKRAALKKRAEEKGLIQVSDESEIAKIVEQVIKDNAKAAEDIKNGEMKAIGFLVGQVMKASKGKANPQLAQDLIKQQLGL